MAKVATTLDTIATSSAPWLFFAAASWNLYNVMKERTTYNARLMEGQKTAKALRLSLENIDKKIDGVIQDLDDLEEQIVNGEEQMMATWERINKKMQLIVGAITILQGQLGAERSANNKIQWKITKQATVSSVVYVDILN